MITTASAVDNPFPGLRPFEFNDSHLFFGRERDADVLVSRLSEFPFIAVIGPSGIGKSSLLRAGLLPSLKSGFLTKAGSFWRVALMTPRDEPIPCLAEVLHDPEALGGDAVQIEITLRRSSLGLIESVRQARLEPAQNVLLIVDQFEQLIGFSSDRPKLNEESNAFVQLLLGAIGHRDCPLYIAIAMRSDYLDICSEFRGLREVLDRGLYLIPGMGRDQTREAIELPAEICGSSFTPPLVQRLLNDVGDDPTPLPALQHVLMRMWNIAAPSRARGEVIGFTHYELAGTLSEAVSRHADEVLHASGHDNAHARAARKIFQQLTESVPGHGNMIRPASVKMLCAVAGVDFNLMFDIINAFRSAGFLRLTHGVSLGHDTVIEICHESLISRWNKLHTWVQEEARSADVYRRLLEAARSYTSGDGVLYGEPELSEALLQREAEWNDAWAERYGGDFERTTEFLEKSKFARDHLIAKGRQKRLLVKSLVVLAWILAGAVLGSVLTIVWQLIRS